MRYAIKAVCLFLKRVKNSRKENMEAFNVANLQVLQTELFDNLDNIFADFLILDFVTENFGWNMDFIDVIFDRIEELLDRSIEIKNYLDYVDGM